MKRALDSYYTPKKLAEILLSHATSKSVRTVADFCVGGGELLLAAKRRFPNVLCYGWDISEDAILKLRKSHPEWTLSCRDFLSDSDNPPITYDLIVLNPPFSCRGSVVKTVYIDREEYHVSTAMQFLIRSLDFMNEGTELLAILPVSIVTSQKDRNALQRLREIYSFNVLEERLHEQFVADCAPNIILLSVKMRDIGACDSIDLFPFHEKTVSIPIMSVERGRLPMHKVVYTKGKCSGSIRLIHTTNLRHNAIVDCPYIKKPQTSVFKGPAILIPRVCHPNVEKVVVLKGREEFAVSDCVFVLLVESEEKALFCQQTIIKEWSSVKLIYKGTGAVYATLESLKKMFMS